MKWSRILVLGFVMLTSCSNQQEKSIKFRFNYDVGKAYQYAMTDTVRGEESTLLGKTFQIDHYQQQDYVIEVKEQEENDYYKLDLHLIVTGDTMVYSEDFPEDKKRKENMINYRNTFALRMSPSGQIFNVKGSDEKSTRFYEEAYKTNQPVFPEKAITPGYKWQKNVYIDYGEGDPVVATTDFKFIGYETVDNEECAVISFKSDLSYETNLSTSKYNKQHYKKWIYNYSNTSKGKIYFAYEKGYLLRKENFITFKSHSDIVDENGKPLTRFSVKNDKETILLKQINDIDQMQYPPEAETWE